MRYLILLILTITLSSCILAGEPEDSELRISANSQFRVDDSTTVQLPININIRSGRMSVKLTPDDIGSGLWQALPLDTDGNLLAKIELLNEMGNVIATNSTTFDLHSDLLLSVFFSVTKGNPQGGCWGCLGSVSTPLGHLNGFTPADSLSIVWGSSSKSSPVYY